jgi:undecaprenyl-diphosphatase
LFIKKMYTAALWFGLTISLSPGVLVHLMKPVIGRERPEFLRLAAESTYSFPSGHSTASTVFYGMLGLILILSVQKLWKKIIIAFITVTIILFVMASRIYLGVHFPTDVLAGFSFGAATVLLSLSLYHLALPKFSQWLRSKDITDKSLSLFQ